ncbi:Protein kinase domain [Carpediemonas membranifera]|uniref:non-specific serine/threonine protein kinase n=1 Tax=Carpediemonas membranifera TaxID=201153 RepID=A0A8J6ARR8_9EUKA|nr:Protein kinase domain [Carpediemonas membranifera]|eukprot:KAG9390590.1 Protein kinase domain [Carpediemonas membranifera]
MPHRHKHQNTSTKVKVVSEYKIGKQLGSGSFGTVHLGVHMRTGHSVGVKILSRAKIRELNMGEKIQREINILKLFNHPHIVRLYEVLETERHIYLVQEYVSGGELFDFIVSQTITEDMARHFFQQLISAVAYCHSHQVVHRDLKPENLLLSSHKNIKLADFGLSNIMADGDFLSTSCGSPNYAAPEVVSGKHYIGPQIDVWSCGIILFALLTGSLPFDDYKLPNLFAKIKKAQFHMPSCVNPMAQDLIRRMLVVNPDNRIKIDEIRRHPWFRQDLPLYIDHLLDCRTVTAATELDPDIFQELVRYGFSQAEIDEAVAEQRFSSQVMVAYALISDMRCERAAAPHSPLTDGRHPFRDYVFNTFVEGSVPQSPKVRELLSHRGEPVRQDGLFSDTEDADPFDIDAVNALSANASSDGINLLGTPGGRAVMPPVLSLASRPKEVLVIPPSFAAVPELDAGVFSLGSSSDSLDLNTDRAYRPLRDTRTPKLCPKECAPFVLGVTMGDTGLISPVHLLLIVLSTLRKAGYEWKIGRSVVRIQSVQELRRDHNTGQPTAPMSTLTPDAAGDMVPDGGVSIATGAPKRKARDAPSIFSLRFRVAGDQMVPKSHRELRFGLNINVLPGSKDAESERYVIDVKRLYGETTLFIQRTSQLFGMLTSRTQVRQATEELGLVVPDFLARHDDGLMSPIHQGQLEAGIIV